MRRQSCRAGVAVVLGAAVVFSFGATALAEPLKFAWPVPSTVSVTDKAVKQGNAVTMRYDVTLSKAPDGKRLAVRLKGFEFLEVNGMDARKPEIRKQLADGLKMASAIPTLVVSPEGTFEEITGMDKVIKQLTASLPAEQRAAMMKVVGSPQFAGMIQESSAQFWNVWVGLWAGADIPEGKSRDMDEPFTLPDGSTLKRPITVTNHGPAGPPGHVRLSFVSSLDSAKNAQVRTLLESMVQQFAASAGQEVPKDLFQGGSVSMTGEVITDPATLRPAAARSSKKITVLMKGQPPQGQEETHDYAFAWSRAARKK